MAGPREPSMEDILASIKRVIAEEKELRSGAPTSSAPAPDPEHEADEEAPPEMDAVDLGAPAEDQPPLRRMTGLSPMTAPIVDESDEEFPDEEDEEEDVLELDASDAVVEPAPAPAPTYSAPRAEPVEAPRAEPVEEPAIAPQVAETSRDRFAELAALASSTRATPEPQASGEARDPLESMVREMLRPMLKQWLDTHLGAIVDEQVKREISRITGRKL